LLAYLHFSQWVFGCSVVGTISRSVTWSLFGRWALSCFFCARGLTPSVGHHPPSARMSPVISVDDRAQHFRFRRRPFQPHIFDKERPSPPRLRALRRSVITRTPRCGPRGTSSASGRAPPPPPPTALPLRRSATPTAPLPRLLSSKVCFLVSQRTVLTILLPFLNHH